MSSFILHWWNGLQGRPMNLLNTDDPLHQWTMSMIFCNRRLLLWIFEWRIYYEYFFMYLKINCHNFLNILSTSLKWKRMQLMVKGKSVLSDCICTKLIYQTRDKKSNQQYFLRILGRKLQEFRSKRLWTQRRWHYIIYPVMVGNEKKTGLGKKAINDYAETCFARKKEAYYKFCSQMNPIHTSALGHAKFDDKNTKLNS